MCVGILIGTLYEKLGQGGWVTIAVTSTLIVICFRTRAHYMEVQDNLKVIMKGGRLYKRTA